MINAFRGRMGIRVKAGRARPAAATGVFALRSRDRPSLVAALERIAAIAPGMSDRELQNLARQLCRETAAAGLARSDAPGTRAGGRSRGLAGDREIRVTMTAWNPDQLAERARRAARLAGAVHGGPMISEAGVRVSCGAGGRVVLVFPGGAVTDGAGEGGAAWLAAEAATLARSLDALRWLEGLGASATAAVGHGHGEIAGLVWAGSLSVPEAARLAAQHGEVRRGLRATRTAMVRVIADEATASGLSASCGLALAADEGPRSHVLAGPVAGVRELTRQAATLGVTASVLNAAHALHTPAMLPYAAPLRSVLAQVRFGPPRRRLVSTVTARELRPQDDIAAMLCAQLTSPVRFREALQTASDGADLIFCAGADEALVAAAAACGVPAAGFLPPASLRSARRLAAGRTVTGWRLASRQTRARPRAPPPCSPPESCRTRRPWPPPPSGRTGPRRSGRTGPFPCPRLPCPRRRFRWSPRRCRVQDQRTRTCSRQTSSPRGSPLSSRPSAPPRFRSRPRRFHSRR